MVTAWQELWVHVCVCIDNPQNNNKKKQTKKTNNKKTTEKLQRAVCLLFFFFNSIVFLQLLKPGLKIMTFTILVLCLVGAVRADRCCYQRDCKNGYYCDGAKLGCSMSASRNGYCKLKNGCCYQKDCIDGHYCDGAKMGCSVSSSKNGKCLAKKTHGAKVGKNSDHKCASGAEQCGYCSKTCKEAGGCRVVPEGTLPRQFIFVQATHPPHPHSC